MTTPAPKCCLCGGDKFLKECDGGVAHVHWNRDTCIGHLASCLASLESVVNQMGPQGAEDGPCPSWCGVYMASAPDAAIPAGEIAAFFVVGTPWPKAFFHAADCRNAGRCIHPAPAAPTVEPAPAEKPGPKVEAPLHHVRMFGAYGRTAATIDGEPVAGSDPELLEELREVESYAKVEAPRCGTWHESLRCELLDGHLLPHKWPEPASGADGAKIVMASRKGGKSVYQEAFDRGRAMLTPEQRAADSSPDAPARDGEVVSHLDASLAVNAMWTSGQDDKHGWLLERYIREREAAEKAEAPRCDVLCCDDEPCSRACFDAGKPVNPAPTPSTTVEPASLCFECDQPATAHPSDRCRLGYREPPRPEGQPVTSGEARPLSAWTCTYPKDMDVTEGACPAWWRGEKHAAGIWSSKLEAAEKRIRELETKYNDVCQANLDVNAKYVKLSEECGVRIRELEALLDDSRAERKRLHHEMEVAQNEAADAKAELATARAENMCDACAGTGKPISGGSCMCNGTGKMSVAAVYLRERLTRPAKPPAPAEPVSAEHDPLWAVRWAGDFLQAPGGEIPTKAFDALVAKLHEVARTAPPRKAEPASGADVDVAYSAACVCPFPRLLCPNCDLTCPVCRAATGQGIKVTVGAPPDAPARDGEAVSHAEARNLVRDLVFRVFGALADRDAVLSRVGMYIDACERTSGEVKELREEYVDEAHLAGSLQCVLADRDATIESLRAELATARALLDDSRAERKRLHHEMEVAQNEAAEARARLETAQKGVRDGIGESRTVALPPAPAEPVSAGEGNRERACLFLDGDRSCMSAPGQDSHDGDCDYLTNLLDAAEQRGAAKALDHPAIKAWREMDASDRSDVVDGMNAEADNNGSVHEAKQLRIAARALSALAGDGEVTT